jgi:hypothetical protein
MSKLTLSVNDIVVSRAKQYAKKRGVSISKIVEAHLASVADTPSRATQECPILSSLRGSLKRADLSDYRDHLAAKHR